MLTCVNRCATNLEKMVSGNIVAFTVADRMAAIILMLACIKIRKIFVPIEHETAEVNKIAMLRVAACNDLVKTLDMDSGLMSIQQFNFSPVSSHIDLNGIMSIMFTSGTTGAPKGVKVSYAGVINLLKEPDFFSLESDDIFATYSPLSFDASTFEIFTPLLNGNKLIILDKHQVIDHRTLSQIIQREEITVFWMTAGLFNTLVLADLISGLGKIKKLFIGGDKVDIFAARRFIEHSPATLLFNGYGPTENTVFSTVAALTKNSLNDKSDLIPIGRPVRGTQCVIRNKDGELTTTFPATGRLLLSGCSLTQGYVGLTQDNAFIPHDEAISGYFYDTGDDVFYDETKTYYFLGRKDKQTKLNGYRINLASIEERCKQGGLSKLVYAYISSLASGLVIIGHTSSCNINEHALLKEVLNSWELPKKIFFIEDWPLTFNGKIDYKNLEARAEKLLFETVQTILEEDRLCKLIVDKTNIAIINRDANLFDLGLDSITLAWLQSEIEKTFHVSLDILDIYEAGTLGRLEEKINTKIKGE